MMRHTRSHSTVSAIASLAFDTQTARDCGRRGYQSQWEVFLDQIQPVARTMPWMTVEGNHERDWPGSGDCYGGFNVLDSGGPSVLGAAPQSRSPLHIQLEQLFAPWHASAFAACNPHSIHSSMLSLFVSQRCMVRVQVTALPPSMRSCARRFFRSFLFHLRLHPVLCCRR